jgi:hypothetical protein
MLLVLKQNKVIDRLAMSHCAIQHKLTSVEETETHNNTQIHTNTHAQRQWRMAMAACPMLLP